MTLDMIELLRRVNAVCITLAGLTSNTIDDKLTAAITAILNNETLVNLLRALLQDHNVTNSLGDSRTAAIVQLASAGHTRSGEQALAAAGVKWREFLALLPIIVRIGLTFLGKR
jgi:hypothetical protein